MTVRLSDFILRRRGLALVLFALLLAAGGAAVTRLRVDFSLRQFFSPDDPEVQTYYGVVARYGQDDNMVIVTAKSAEWNATARLKALDEVVRSLESFDAATLMNEAPAFGPLTTPEKLKTPLITRVLSPVNVPLMETARDEAAGEDTLRIRTARDELDDPTLPARLKAALTMSPLYAGTLVAADGAAVALLIRLGAAWNNEITNPFILAGVKRRLAPLTAAGFDVAVGGVPALRTDFAKVIGDETLFLISLALPVMIAVLVLVFRTLISMVICAAIVLLTLVVTFGGMAALNAPVTILSTVIPVVVMVYGVGNPIHFLGRYYEELLKGRGKHEALVATTAHMMQATGITSLTTAVGFAVLGFTNIAILQDFGLFTAFGVMVSYVATILFMPALLGYLGTPSEATMRRYFRESHQQWLADLSGFLQRRRYVVAGVAVLLSVGFAVPGLTVPINSRLVEDLPDNHPIMHTLRYIEAQFGGMVPLEVVIEHEDAAQGAENRFYDPKLLRFADEVKTRMAALGPVRKIDTPVDLIKDLYAKFAPEKAAADPIPPDRATVSQLMLLYDNDRGRGESPIDDLIAPDGNGIRLAGRMLDVVSQEALPTFERLRTEVAAITPPGIRAKVTGTAIIGQRAVLYLINNIFYTFFLAFGIITVLLAIQFRSAKMGLISILPNIVPLTGMLTVMWLIGLPLKPSSAMTFSIALGIAVDDTIHFMTRYLHEYPHDKSHEGAVTRTMLGTGKAMIFTSIMLVVGFSCLWAGDLVSNDEFALLACTSITLAILGDILFLPVVLLVIKPDVGDPFHEGELEAEAHEAAAGET